MDDRRFGRFQKQIAVSEGQCLYLAHLSYGRYTSHCTALRSTLGDYFAMSLPPLKRIFA